MALVQIWVGIVAIPLSVSRAPSDQWYGFLILLSGAVLTLPFTYLANYVVSRMAAEFLEKQAVLACANKDGWIHESQVESLPIERHVRTDAGTTTLLDTFRNGTFLLAQNLMILGIEYGIFIFARIGST